MHQRGSLVVLIGTLVIALMVPRCFDSPLEREVELSFRVEETGGPPEDQTTIDADFADIDGDGDVDLIVLRRRPKNLRSRTALAESFVAVYKNDGTGQLTESELAPFTSQSWLNVAGMDWCDFDSDGDADVVMWFRGKDAEVRVYRNEREGGMVPLVLPLPSKTAWKSPHARWHMTGESTQLIIVGNTQWTVDVIQGFGAGDKLSATHYLLPSDTPERLVLNSSSDWIDYDSDGDLDVAAAPWWGGRSVFLLLGEGGDHFIDATLKHLPDVSLGFEGGDCRWADFDGDGYEDLVVANRGHPTLPDPDLFFRNDGAGGLTWVENALRLEAPDEGSLTRLAPPGVGDHPFRQQIECCDVGDFDGDGDLDVFFLANVNSVSYIAENIGGMRFQAHFFLRQERLPFINGTVLAVGDVDGDSMPDLFVGGLREDKLLINTSRHRE